MRDIFEEIFENQPLDPTESARRNMRPQLRARFYQVAQAGEPTEQLRTDIGEVYKILQQPNASAAAQREAAAILDQVERLIGTRATAPVRA